MTVARIFELFNRLISPKTLKIFCIVCCDSLNLLLALMTVYYIMTKKWALWRHYERLFQVKGNSYLMIRTKIARCS